MVFLLNLLNLIVVIGALDERLIYNRKGSRVRVPLAMNVSASEGIIIFYK